MISSVSLNNLAYSVKMDTAQPTMMTRITNNCCDSINTKVTFNSSQRVTAIDWNSLNLNGSINMTAVPSTVTTLSRLYPLHC